MTDRELKKLSRTELLEMLLEQTNNVERLKAELEQKNKELEDKRLIIARAGSLAEASLQLSGIFDAAQRAADQYLYNVQSMYGSDEVSD